MKEVRFFDERYDRGSSWYEAQFDSVSDQCKVIGDITPGYFSHPKVPDRMLQLLGPNIDLFIMERDPIERAFSEYRGMLRRGETEDSFETALSNSPRLVANSSYATHAQRYINRFGAERIHVVPYQNIASKPEIVIEGFSRILGVPMVSCDSMHEQVNVGTAPAKYRGLRQLVSGLRQQIEHSKVGRNMLWAIRRAGLISRFHQATSAPVSVDQGLEKVDLQHCSRFFAEDQERWKQLRLGLGDLSAQQPG